MTPFQEGQLVLMRQMERSISTNPHAATIVPMQDDFASDPQLALTAVSFLPNDVADLISRTIIEPLKSVEPSFYYYPKASMHLTVQNVRIIHDPPRFTAHDIEIARGVFRQAVMSVHPFTFQLHGVLIMPTSISIIALGSPEYESFVTNIRRDLHLAGVPDDKTYFTNDRVFANITISRFTHTPSRQFVTTMKDMHDRFIGELTIREMSLVTMNAGAHPSKTTILEKYGFGQK